MVAPFVLPYVFPKNHPVFEFVEDENNVKVPTSDNKLVP